MARAIEPPAAVEAAPPPRANPDFLGHDSAERELERLFRVGMLPHAILLGGPRGIGKATLAFRFARFLLAHGRGGTAAGFLGGLGGTGLAIDPDSGAFRRVAAGGHADLLTVERAWDPRRRRLRGDIVVEDTREIGEFLRLTAAEEGWRIVIVDGAEEMNRNAANAVLKILEEPPSRALLLLVSHSPGRLLPTIRSRCRRLMLRALPQAVAGRLIARYRPQLDRAEAEMLAGLCGGSVGRALELVDAGGLALHRSLLELLAQVPAIDSAKLHGFADRLARADAEDGYRAVEELLTHLLARLATGAVPGPLGPEQTPVGEVVAAETTAVERLAARADPARWATLCGEIERDFTAARDLNLDRKQTMLGAFFAIAEAAR
jgi:DNA polymerase III subunit delta'